VTSRIEPLTRFVWRAGEAMPASLFERAKERAQALARSLSHFHEKYDVLVTSTLACVPKLIEETDPRPSDVRLASFLATPVARWLMRLPGAPDRLLDTQVETMIERVPYRTSLANLTGQPAMSVPLFWTENALPIGVQFLAPFGAEGTLLQLAAQLERAQPWVSRLPMHSGS
jgi:amidase